MPGDTSSFSMTATYWQNSKAPKIIKERNMQYVDMCQLGYDAHKLIIHTPKQMAKLIGIFERHAEDGKMGHRLDLRKRGKFTEFPWTVLSMNATIFSIQSTYHIKTINVPPVKWDVRCDTKNTVLNTLKEAAEWQKSMKVHDDKRGRIASSAYNGYNEYGNSYGVLELHVGVFRGSACGNCKRPHYEHVIASNSFHVCPFCGWQYPGSNIQMVAQLRTNDDGVQMGHHHAAPGMTTDPFCYMGGKRSLASMINQGYRVKVDNRIKTMIGVICDKLNCDNGDGEHHLRIWAWKKYEHYSAWLAKEAKWEGVKNKMGQWQIAAAFVWMSILQYEKRIFQSTVWSLSTICETAAELQDGDAYIPNYALQAKRKRKQPTKIRKTRKVRLETVHRYAQEISSEYPRFSSVFGIIIPDIHSIECMRQSGTQMKSATDKYTMLQGKSAINITLPPDQSWDIDIIIKNDFIVVEPDLDGLGFKLGLRTGDIIRSINGTGCPKTVDDTFDVICDAKAKKIKTVSGYKLKPITITVLR
jgi:hypothetical protein